jgi:hypothetical protein
MEILLVFYFLHCKMASKDSSLIQAASEGDLAKVQNLIEKQSCNINAQGAMNRSPLHLGTQKYNTHLTILSISVW